MQYNGMTPPFELISFEDMKKKQAEQYFVWYIYTIEQRIQNLEKYINLTGTRMVLDKTPNSLIELWDWFSNHIEVCTKDEQELCHYTQGAEVAFYNLGELNIKQCSGCCIIP